MFRPVQGHHQGGIYKGIQIQQVASKDVRAGSVKIQHITCFRRQFLRKLWSFQLARIRTNMQQRWMYK
jgi:hypothetical protein